MTRPAPQPCGTYPAYERHRRNGETPCAPCREAKRVVNTASRRRQARLKADEREALEVAVMALIYRHRGEFAALMLRAQKEAENAA